MPPTLDELLSPDEAAGLLGLASAAADGAPIGLVDTEDHLIAGRSAGPVAAHRHPVELAGRPAGAVVGDARVDPALLALVARSIELILVGAIGTSERARVAQELAIGRRIQQALVPHRFPEVEGWAFAAAYEPALEVGGDLYDVFPVQGRTDRIGLLVADVTGKGIPAALLMADVRALLHAATDNAPGPADALRRVNRILVTERRTSLFVTALLVVVDSATGVFRYASAGHEPPFVARRGGAVDELDAHGPLLGAFADAVLGEREDRLEPGDTLVLYTDGVTEARDERRQFFGEGRLVDAVGAACAFPADAVVDSIVRGVHEFRGAADAFDDLTLLVAARAG